MGIDDKRVFIGIGSNIEPRSEYILKSVAAIAKEHRVVRMADCLETEPWGFEAKVKFLNTVIEIRTDFSPLSLLLHLQEIEKSLGRTTKSQNKNYQSRTVDLDLLYYGREILISPVLTIPHPELYQRLFVLEPLHQIAPDYRDPVKMKPVIDLFEDLKSQ